MNERYEDYFDELVRVYSLPAARQMGITDAKVVTSLRRIFSDARGTGLTSDDMDNLIDAETPDRDRVASKIAWLLAHCLDGKVWGVNLQLSSTRQGDEDAPLLRQIERAGVTVCDCNWQRSANSLKAKRRRWQKTVDAVGVSADRKRVILVKGAPFSSLRRKSQNLAVVGGGSNLFTQGRRLLANTYAPADSVAALILARAMAQGRFGDAEIVPVFMVVDDIGAGWQFEATDLSQVSLRELPDQGEICLDQLPVFASSARFAGVLREDIDALNRIPASSSISPLYGMPPDRRARALMILDVIRAEQSANDAEVVPIPPHRIRRLVEERYDLHYPVDMLRHDLIACDQGRQLITRIRGAGPRYTSSPVGMARYYWALAKLSSPPPEYVDEVMQRVFKHAELVWKSRGL